MKASLVLLGSLSAALTALGVAVLHRPTLQGTPKTVFARLSSNLLEDFRSQACVDVPWLKPKPDELSRCVQLPLKREGELWREQDAENKISKRLADLGLKLSGWSNPGVHNNEAFLALKGYGRHMIQVSLIPANGQDTYEVVTIKLYNHKELREIGK